MHQIKCPHCGKEFTIDEASYADILNQVRTKEFNDEIHEKLDQIKSQHQSELELLEERANNTCLRKYIPKAIIYFKFRIHIVLSFVSLIYD
ncbi:hypothetical protein [Pseudolactococcus carnosus]|uniref:hypothetical protein n=1 Tax=Pseudolactococcus carnosus TaxID=2749961 RepID=UPI001FBAEB91|nr:hypothetical protein [Lactococcus carnosus]